MLLLFQPFLLVLLLLLLLLLLVVVVVVVVVLPVLLLSLSFVLLFHPFSTISTALLVRSDSHNYLHRHYYCIDAHCRGIFRTLGCHCASDVRGSFRERRIAIIREYPKPQ